MNRGSKLKTNVLVESQGKTESKKKIKDDRQQQVINKNNTFLLVYVVIKPLNKFNFKNCIRFKSVLR